MSKHEELREEELENVVGGAQIASGSGEELQEETYRPPVVIVEPTFISDIR